MHDLHRAGWFHGIDTLVGELTDCEEPDGALVAGTVVSIGMATLMTALAVDDDPIGALTAGTLRSNGIDTVTTFVVVTAGTAVPMVTLTIPLCAVPAMVATENG